MKWMTLKQPKCNCEADQTEISTVRAVPRGNPARIRRAQRIRHFRERDSAHFWHWSDVEVGQTPWR